MPKTRPKGNRISLFTAIVLLGLGLSALPLNPAPHRSQERPALKYDVAVTVKLVQVYVTDKKGNAVGGLEKADFTIFDDGVEKTITEFERHVLTASSGRSGSRPAGLIVPTPLSSRRITGRKIFLFFDFAYTTPRGFLKAKEAALHFLNASCLPDDEVGLISYSALTGIRVNEFLSLDHNKILGTVAKLELGSVAVGQATDVEEEYVRQLENGKIPANEWERSESKNIARNYLENLTNLGKALRYIPGSKQIIYFSSGIPSSLLQGLVLSDNSSLNNRSGMDYILLNARGEALDALNSASCAIFSFDTRGNDVNLFSKDEAAFRDRDSLASRSPTTSTVFKPTNLTGEGTLRYVSKATGGKYFGNINEYEMDLEELQKLTGTYYVLGYPINEKWDGQFHKIQVKTKKKGYEVHAQAGYFSPKPFSEYSDLEKQFHLVDLALSDQPLFQTPQRFALASLGYAEGGSSRLQMVARIPAAVIAKFQGKKVEIVSLIFNEKDELSSLQRSTADLFKNRGGEIAFSSGATLPPGPYACRVVVRDLDTGTGAVASGKTFVPNSSKGGLSLYTPLLLIRGSGPVYLEPPASKAKAEDSWNAVYPYDRAQYVPLLNEIPAGTSTLYALVPCALRVARAEDISLKAFLIASSTGEKKEIPYSILSRNVHESVESRLLELSLGNTPAGKYTLYFYAADPVTKATAYTQTTVTVK